MDHYLKPQFESLGQRPAVMGARYLELFGTQINVGKSATFVATKDSKIRLTTWNLGDHDGKIEAGDFPKPVDIDRVNKWLESEIHQWLNSKNLHISR